MRVGHAATRKACIESLYPTKHMKITTQLKPWISHCGIEQPRVAWVGWSLVELDHIKRVSSLSVRPNT